MTPSLWRFLGFWLIYSFISIVVLLFSSGGWTALAMFYAAPIFYGSLFCLILLVSLILYAQGVREIIIAKKTLSFVVVLQALTVLLNYGDCGDAPGGSAFLVRLFLPDNVLCQSNTAYGGEVFMWLSQGFLCLLAITYLIVLGSTFWKAAKRKSVSVFPLLIIYILVFLAISSAAVYILTADYRAEQSRLSNPNTICVGDCGPEWEGRTYGVKQNEDGTLENYLIR